MITNKNIELLSKYLFIVLMFFLPLSLEMSVPGTQTKILWLTEPISGILTLLIFLYLWKNRNQEFKLSAIDKVALLFILSIIFSTIFSSDHINSIKYTVTVIWYFCSGYLLVRIFKFNEFQRRASLVAFLLGTLLLSLYVLVNFIRFGIFYESSYRVSAPFIMEGHTDMSAVIEPAFLIAAILLLTINWKNIESLKKLFVLNSIFLAVIMFSCSKASYAALALSAFFFGVILLIKKPKYLVKLAYFAIPLLLFVGLWQLNDYMHKVEVSKLDNSYYNSGSQYYNPNDKSTYKTTNMIEEFFTNSTNTKKNESNLERINRWLTGLKMYSNNPSFGIGMGTFPDKYLEYVNKNQVKVETNFLTGNRMNLHNLYLNWLIEGGLLTLLTGLSLITLFFIWTLSELKTGKNSWFKTILFLFMIGFCFHGFVHDFNQNARIIIPFWTAMALVSRQMGDKFLPNFLTIKETF